MIGPCLCGDPYCPSCGNPGAAAWEEWCEGLIDRLSDLGLDDYEARLFERVGTAAVEAYREARTAPDIAFEEKQ